ncbi:MAG: glucosaminidase domain-containing protein, partial [Bacilli bacterium]|nr:glucosaminidase domain-containing protein [Bacilli bacterium]
MNNTANDNLVIVQNGMIIDAKYALIDYDQNTKAGYTNVYGNVYLSTLLTYIRGGNTDDAVFLGVDIGTGRIKIKVSGVVGYIARYEYEGTGENQLYDIVPLSWVRSPSYYQITSSEIIHMIPQNVYGDKSTASIVIGKKPTMVAPGNYYSYDGQYFYTDLKVMILDYQAGVTTHAVNPNEPYYNYYQYLNFRTKTNYNAANLNQFIVNRGHGGNKMANTGDAFLAAQEKYGVNAALMFAIGINESAYGSSTIAKGKNNLFG